MKIAVLLFNRRPARLVGSSYVITNPIYTIWGILSQFEVSNIIYIHDSVIIAGKSVTGYFRKDILQSIKNSSDAEELNLKVIMFDNTFEYAVKGDRFEIEKIDFPVQNGAKDFANFYNRAKYSFKIQKLYINFYNTIEYPIANSTTSDINSNNFSIVERTYHNNNDSAVGNFYYVNFGSKVASLLSSGLTENQVEFLAQEMVSICFGLQFIFNEHILDVIAKKPFSDIYDAIHDKYVNGSNSNYDNLQLVDKIIGELRKEWGIFWSHGIAAKDFFPTINLDLLRKFNAVLNGFYQSLYLVDETTIFKYDVNGNPVNEHGSPLAWASESFEEVDSRRRITKIIQLLPSLSFSIFSPELRLILLDRVLEYSEIYQERIETSTESSFNRFSYDDVSIMYEDEVIKLIESFSVNDSDANLLLDFLLKTKSYESDGIITNFEVLYNLINDRKTIVINLIEYDNRKKLIDALYTVWQISKYNPFYFPSGIPNEDNINLQSFFTSLPGESNYIESNQQKEFVLEFSSHGSGSGGLYSTATTSYKVDKKIYRDKVKVLRFENYSLEGSEYMNDEIGYNSRGIPIIFHLFQPVTIIGYNPNIDLGVEFPNQPVPAFLFYYYEEYDRLKHSDALLNLTLYIVIEVGLFIATGGTSVVSDLRYLKYVSKIGRVLNGSSTAIENLYFWKGIDNLGQSIALTSSILMSYNQYRANVADTVEEREFLEKASRVFFFFTLISVGSTWYARNRVAKACEELFEHPKFFQLPQDVKNFVAEVKGSVATTLVEFKSKFNNHAHLLDQYENVLSADLKAGLFKDFGNLSGESEIWGKLNNPQILENWKDLYIRGVSQRTLISVISDTETTRVFKIFYDDLLLRNIIEPLDEERKLRFINSLRGISAVNFTKFVDDPTLVNKYLRFLEENTFNYVQNGIIKNKFLELGHSNMLRTLEELGDLSEDLFKGFIRNPNNLTIYNNLDDAGRQLLSDNRHFWLIYDLSFDKVEKLQPLLDISYNKILRDKGANAFEWFTNPLNKSSVINYLKQGKNWENGKAFEIIAESHIKSNFLNSNTDVIMNVDIHLYNNAGSLIKKDILELDFIVINRNTNKIDDIGSVKIGNRFYADHDLKKLDPLYKEIPNTIMDVRDYLTNTLNVRIKNNGIQNVVEVKVVGVDLRTNNTFNETIVNFKVRIKPLNQYDKNTNYKKINPKTLNISKEDIAENAYHSIINKF